jgi:hypothetical protein
LVGIPCRGKSELGLTLRDEDRLTAFGNRVLRKTFGANGDEVTEKWRRLHNEELYDLYFPPNIVRLVESSIRQKWENFARKGDL